MINRKIINNLKILIPRKVFLTWFCLFIGLFLIYYIFIQQDIVKELDQKITFIIASFGALFSIIQFWINSIRHRDDFIRNLRYEEYKRVREITNRFFNSLSENMGEEQNIHRLSRILMDIKNELVVIMQITNKSIFKGILQNESVIEFGKKSDIILTKTDQLRYKIDQLNDKKDSYGDTLQFAISVEIMNWHNEMIGEISELHRLKYHLFEFMEDKLI
jgi:hypothetical protein